MYVYSCNALSARFFAVDRALNSYFMIMIMIMESEPGFWPRVKLQLQACTTPWLYIEPSTTQFRQMYSSCPPQARSVITPLSSFVH